MTKRRKHVKVRNNFVTRLVAPAGIDAFGRFTDTNDLLVSWSCPTYDTLLTGMCGQHVGTYSSRSEGKMYVSKLAAIVSFVGMKFVSGP